MVQTRHWKKEFATSIYTIFTIYCCPIFQVVRTKELNKKPNPAASKMKPFVTLVDGLFGKQLNNITKNPISDDPRSTSLLSIWKKRVWFIHLFRTYCSRVCEQVKSSCVEVRLRTLCALKQGAPFNWGIG